MQIAKARSRWGPSTQTNKVLRAGNIKCRAIQIPKRTVGRAAPPLEVPAACFGCMLFGESTDYQTAGHLLSTCLDTGTNFFDTAEMYPVPQAEHSSGDSERMLGRWLKDCGVSRDKVMIASKVAGPSGMMTWIRGGPHKVDARNIREAIDGSLTRLGTDYLDVLYIHWPDRYVPMFGDIEYDPVCAYSGDVPLEDQLAELGRAVAAGKVRHVGLSNETPYGLTRALMAAKSEPSLPRVALLSNALSLTCRTFDTGLAEVCHVESVGLAAYSPLAMGLLTGKYLAPGGGPPAARLNKYKGRYAEAESRYGPKPNVQEAVSAYCALARQAGMTPTELAIRWVACHPLVSTLVIGATNTQQLQEQLQAIAAPPLSQDVLEQVDKIHVRYPNPTP